MLFNHYLLCTPIFSDFLIERIHTFKCLLKHNLYCYSHLSGIQVSVHQNYEFNKILKNPDSLNINDTTYSTYANNILVHMQYR